MLSVGATEPAAGLIVPELAKRGIFVRGVVHDLNQRDAERNDGAAKVVVGDLADRSDVEAALRGMSNVFYLENYIAKAPVEKQSLLEAWSTRFSIRRFR